MTTAWADFAMVLDEALARFVAGDPEPYIRLWSDKDDIAIMGGFGSYEQGAAPVRARLRWAAEQYRGGRLEIERVSTLLGTDLACVAAIERATGVAGDPERGMELRVTQVARLEPAGWRIVHRHADVLLPTAAPAPGQLRISTS